MKKIYSLLGIPILIMSAVLFSFTILSCHKSALPISEIKTWKIVVAETAIPSEKYAAEEFQEILRKGTGFQLPIVYQADSSSGNIFIGHSQAMERSDVGFPTANFSEEELQIKIASDNIALAGGKPRGTLYSVYEFFERFLGTRFLTKDHIYFPPDIVGKTLPLTEFRYNPIFLFRYTYFGEIRRNPKFATRLRVNTVTDSEKYGGKTSQQLINHSFHRQIPAKIYGKDHPEYFALTHGERKVDMWGGGPQLDVSNSEVIDLMSEKIFQEIEEHPKYRNYSVSQNDNDYYCRCDSCEAINEKEGTPMGAQLRFVNEVARRVAKKYPDKKIGTLSYWYTRKPPKHLKPEGNVQIQLADIECCRLHAIDDPDCPKNRAFMQDLLNWSKIAKELYVWTYATDFRYYDLPIPNLKSISKNLKFYAAHHVKGVFEQGNSMTLSGEMSDLRNYVISRCLWNPELDSWKLAKEFCDLHYGKAAPIIWEYLNFEHDWVEKYGHHPTCFASPKELGLNQKFSLKAFDYFNRALAVAENVTIHRRVEKISLTAYRAMLEAGREFYYENGFLKRRFPEGFENTVEKYLELAHKFNLTAADERTPFDKFELKLKTDYLQGIPALKLENSNWELIFTPQDNGKMVVMHHKPDGRQLLQMLDNNFMYGAFDEVPGEHMDLSKLKYPFSARVEKDKIVLTRKLSDGSVYQRTIWLSEQYPDKIFCKTSIVQKGKKPGTYQFVVHPEFYTETSTNDSRVLSAYVKYKGKWMVYNKALFADQGPDAHLLVDAKDGGIHAFFNHKKKFGILETYDPGKIEKLRTWWIPGENLINLELLTKQVTLQPEEEFSFTYEFEYLYDLNF